MRRASRPRSVLWLIAILAMGGVCTWLWLTGTDEGKIEPAIAPNQPVLPRPTVVESVPKPRIVVDSRMSRVQALGRNKFPYQILNKMDVVSVNYIGFDGLEHVGQIVIDKELTTEVRQIFDELRLLRYPIKQVVPVVRFGWDDLRSMRANNTSGFNYRGQVTPNGTSRVLSKHALGRAIDLNPWLNPYVSSSGKSTSTYRPSVNGTLTRDSAATKAFLRRGWKWGGNWSGSKDYQHFEKP